ncbi:MAG: hypothetical protein JXQ76_01970 [Campylobacterales bacterium]|nr:hypothetical protein [Campylobacterales bacterium]
MKRKILSVIAAGFLLASCGGGGGGSVDNSVDNTTPTNDNDINLTGDGTQTTIDNTVNQTPSNYAVPAISEVYKQKFLDAVNNARAEARDCGDGKGIMPSVNPLTWNDKLYSAAYEHNYDMANTGNFSHTGSGTQYDITGIKLGKASSSEDRVVSNGYYEGATTTLGFGENLAAGNLDVDYAIKLWIESPGHCVNLMNGDFEEMGMSKVQSVNESGYYYFTHLFGISK